MRSLTKMEKDLIIFLVKDRRRLLKAEAKRLSKKDRVSYAINIDTYKQIENKLKQRRH